MSCIIKSDQVASASLAEEHLPRKDQSRTLNEACSASQMTFLDELREHTGSSLRMSTANAANNVLPRKSTISVFRHRPPRPVHSQATSIVSTTSVFRYRPPKSTHSQVTSIGSSSGARRADAKPGTRRTTSISFHAFKSYPMRFQLHSMFSRPASRSGSFRPILESNRASKQVGTEPLNWTSRPLNGSSEEVWYWTESSLLGDS